ncbi:MAG: hypothetical protein Q8K72_15865 [Acidimicrobiales bacterium]|nr:hypothetical protein [Acidimicrobiales bacterium]
MARAKARKPLKLRVVGGEDGSGRLPTRPSERPGGWANERLSLRSLAVALEHLAG